MSYVEAMMVLRRQIDLVRAEVRITERQLEKAEVDSEPYRAAAMRRDILTGKLGELSEGLRRLESPVSTGGPIPPPALPEGAAKVAGKAPARRRKALEKTGARK